MFDFKLFQQQHQRVKYIISLLEGLDAGDRNPQHVKNFAQIREIVIFRNRLVERCILPVLHRKKESKILNQSVARHHAKIYRMVGDMYDVDPQSEDFQYMLKNFKQSFDEFAEVEENQLIPYIKKNFTPEQIENLKHQIEQISDVFNKDAIFPPDAELLPKAGSNFTR